MRNKTIRKILFLAAGSVFLFSSVMVARHYLEMRSSAEHTETVTQAVVSPAPEPSETAPIQVDFDALCAENPDVIGWLYCPDTPIHYPVVQASDNESYLHRLLDGSSNAAGTLFLDYRNAADLSDWNSVIHGHNMINDSMFGSLTDYREQAYFDAHPRLFLLTPERDYIIELMAGFTTPATAALYSAFSPDEEEKAGFLESWLNASDFVSGNVPAAGDRFVTLSTCSYEYSDARYVLIGIVRTLGDQQEQIQNCNNK